MSKFGHDQEVNSDDEYSEAVARPRVIITSCEGLPEGCFPVPDDFPHARAALQLVWSSLGIYSKPGDTFALGTCFMVGDGVAATATHNLDWLRTMLERDGVRHPPGEVRFNLGVVERGTGLSMRVIGTNTFGDSEITFLDVDRHESLGEHPLSPPLTLRTSRIRADEPLTLVGFAEQDVELDEQVSAETGENVVHVQGTPIIARGFVVDEANKFLVHDSTIHVAGVETMPGMSGGPVFDEADRVIGLISRSMIGGGYSIVARWSQAFSMEGFQREHFGPITLSTSSGRKFVLQIHNVD